jgi:type II secretory pathway pseudopilin PulG
MAPHRRHSRNQREQQGLVLLTVLAFILVTTLAASSLVVSFTTQMQREKEEQLLFVGDQFRRAIASYYNTIPPGGTRSFPPSLEALANDQRFATPVQHIRRVYVDPMTGRADWTLVREGGGMVGIASQSAGRPIKKKGFAKDYEYLQDKEKYSDWVFSIRGAPSGSP